MITPSEYPLRSSCNISFHSKFILQLPEKTKSEVGQWRHSHLNLSSSPSLPRSPSWWLHPHLLGNLHAQQVLTQTHQAADTNPLVHLRHVSHWGERETHKAAQWNTHICQSVRPSVNLSVRPQQRCDVRLLLRSVDSTCIHEGGGRWRPLASRRGVALSRRWWDGLYNRPICHFGPPTDSGIHLVRSPCSAERKRGRKDGLSTQGKVSFVFARSAPVTEGRGFYSYSTASFVLLIWGQHICCRVIIKRAKWMVLF